ADGTYTVKADVSDIAGNSAIEAMHMVALDTDKGFTATLAVNDTADHIINASEAHSVAFTVGGLDDEAGTVTFADGTNHVTVNVSGNGTFTADLTPLNDGPISSALAVSDAAGNHLS